MKIIFSALAATCLLGALPGTASAGDDELCIGPACIAHHEHHDDFVREDHDSCRDVVIHEDRGDEQVTKHIRRCD